MFLDLWFSFCCSKRPKNQNDQQPISNQQQYGPMITTLQTESFEFSQFVDLQRLRLTPQLELDQNKLKKIVMINSNLKKTQTIKSINGSYYFCEFLAQLFGGEQQFQKVNQFEIYFLRPSSSILENQEQIKKKIKKIDKNPSDISYRQMKIWEPKEDLQLRTLFKQFDGNWREIAQRIPGRNMNQCAQRWRRINPELNQKKNKWTYEIDQRIIELVKQKGRNWAEIAKEFPGKSSKQIRERYLNKLDSNLNTEQWTKEEDQIILARYKEEGPKWSLIASQLKGRSDNMVKNRFYSYIRRVILGQQNPYSVVMTPSERRVVHSEGSLTSGTSYTSYESSGGNDEINEKLEKEQEEMMIEEE